MITIFSVTDILLIISTVMIVFLLAYILGMKNKTQLHTVFALDLTSVFIICSGVLAQSFCTKAWNADAYMFEKYIYVGTCTLPVFMFFTGLIYSRKKIRIRKSDFLFMVVPLITIYMVWTNQLYSNYSTNLEEVAYTGYGSIHTIYTFSLLLIGIFMLLRSATKNSGFFSKQCILLVIGSIVPLAINLVGTLRLISMDVSITPISFAFTMLCFALAIFKFQFLDISPIALRVTVDRMSDSYLILNENMVITDFNETLLHTFGVTSSIRRSKISTFLDQEKFASNINRKKVASEIKKLDNTSRTYTFEIFFQNLKKYFTVEITKIYNKGAYLGILILLKDISQHKEDIKQIKDSQNIIMERERLATLGQMVGGIAHNLKTPIMSIAGAMEGLQDLISEYDKSIDDPEVTPADHHAIANDMKEWVKKVNSYDAYMSDIITAVKGQAVNFNDSTLEEFTIDELLKRVEILMKHELKNALVTLNIDCQVSPLTTLQGNVNSIVQVVNNLISNAIQSYNGVPNKEINLTITSQNNNITISVQDFGCGIPKEVQEKIFNKMITTKGHNGTGLGLFMSYSTIKGHYGGDLNFTSEEGKGTTFNIVLPFGV